MIYNDVGSRVCLYIYIILCIIFVIIIIRMRLDQNSEWKSRVGPSRSEA